MALISKTGNLLYSEADALVNTVNCVGIMGKGIALQFKRQYPEILKPYQAACRNGTLKPGGILVTPTNDGKIIINFATKDHWKHNSEIQWIESGVSELKTYIQANSITSVAMPALGCGCGGLNFSEVKIKIAESGIAAIANVELYLPR